MTKKAEIKKRHLKMSNAEILKRISFIAAFSAITCVLYSYLKIDGKYLPIFPSFLDINFSMIPIIICAFMLGPIDASVVVIVRCLIKWITPGTSTQYVGELADVLIGLAACIPAGVIYKYSKFKHKTIIALASVVIGWVLMGILSNIFINIPWYNNLYFDSNYYKDGIHPVLVNMVDDAVYKITFEHLHVTKSNFMPYYIIFAVIPFNIMLSVVVTIFTALVHKRLRVLYDMIGPKKSDEIFEETKKVEETKEPIDKDDTISLE